MPSNYTGHVFAAEGRRPAQCCLAAAKWNEVQQPRRWGDVRSEAENSSPVFVAARVVERSGGFFVPIEIAIQKTVPVFSASVHVPRYFKVQGTAGFYAYCSASLARSERINRK